MLTLPGYVIVINKLRGIAERPARADTSVVIGINLSLEARQEAGCDELFLRLMPIGADNGFNLHSRGASEARASRKEFW
jgi:hypothetical protein